METRSSNYDIMPILQLILPLIVALGTPISTPNGEDLMAIEDVLRVKGLENAPIKCVGIRDNTERKTTLTLDGKMGAAFATAVTQRLNMYHVLQ